MRIAERETHLRWDVLRAEARMVDDPDSGAAAMTNEELPQELGKVRQLVES